MTSIQIAQHPALKRTPLYDLHVANGARMSAFAGYEMPIQYPFGIMKEHLHTRASVGLFDVSHMGQITLRPRNGTVADVAAALEPATTMLPNRGIIFIPFATRRISLPETVRTDRKSIPSHVPPFSSGKDPRT